LHKHNRCCGIGYGAAKKQSARLTAQLQAVLSVLEVLPLEAPVDSTYGALGARLERTGRPIGANDLLIAAQTLALGYTMVTDNEREFEQIKDLPRDNRLRNN
jgi:tRNA(fMet)-specific endonuclease VapC